MTSDQPQEDLMKDNFFQPNSWSKTTDTFNDGSTPIIKYFSAVCLLTATYWAELSSNSRFGFGYIVVWQMFGVTKTRVA